MSGFFPIGGDSIGGDGVTHTGFYYNDGVESIDLSDSALSKWIVQAIETAHMSTIATAKLHGKNSVVVSIGLSDIAIVVYKIISSESITISASQTNTYRQLVAAVDTLVASGLATSRIHAINTIAELLAIDSMAACGGVYNLTETITLQDTLVQRAHFYQTLIEQAVIADTLAYDARFTMQVEEGIVLSATATSKATFFEYLTQGLCINAVLRIGDTEYLAWVMNTNSLAVSRYVNFGFNSMCEFNNTYYGMMDDGLYELAGDDDQGDDIDAYVRTGLMNFGAAAMKGIVRAYVYLSRDDRMLLKATVTSPKGIKETYWYELEGQPSSVLRDDRGPIGGGLQSVFWQFTIANVAGGDFDVSGMKILPLYLSRRI